MIIPNRFLRGPILPRVQSSNVTLGFVLQRKEGVNVTSPREKFRSVLAGKVPILAANIFDPLSARIAQILEYEVLHIRDAFTSLGRHLKHRPTIR